MIVQFPSNTKVVDLQDFAARQGKKLRFLPAMGKQLTKAPGRPRSVEDLDDQPTPPSAA